jgi:hypothetical protein
VLDDNELGQTWKVAKAMAQFAGTGVDILNLSFGCYTDDDLAPPGTGGVLACLILSHSLS